VPPPTDCLPARVRSLFLVGAIPGSPAMAGGQAPQAEVMQIYQPEPLFWFHFVETPAVLKTVEFPRAGWHLARPPVRWHGAQGSYDHSFFCDLLRVTALTRLPRRCLRGRGLGRLSLRGCGLLRGRSLDGLRFTRCFLLRALDVIRQLFQQPEGFSNQRSRAQYPRQGYHGPLLFRQLVVFSLGRLRRSAGRVLFLPFHTAASLSSCRRVTCTFLPLNTCTQTRPLSS
jgi:hypothetical protein